jgi:hypothetical protein
MIVRLLFITSGSAVRVMVLFAASEKVMVSSPGVLLASSMAARNVHLLFMSSQIPSGAISGLSEISLTVRLSAGRTFGEKAAALDALTVPNEGIGAISIAKETKQAPNSLLVLGILIKRRDMNAP